MKFLDKEFTDLELASACDLLNTITPSEPLNDKGQLYRGRHETYDDSFPGDKLRNGEYDFCTFENTKFRNTIGNSSVIVNSEMKNCVLNNANFIYSDFTNTRFNVSIDSSNLGYCDFSDASFLDGKLNGTSFDRSYFQNTFFDNVMIEGCSFNNSFFYYTRFSNIDLTATSFNQAQFVNSQFGDRVTLPFFHILQIATGIEDILSQDNINFKPVGSKYSVTTYEYISDIHMLIPIFFKENNFIALANIYKFEGDIDHTKAAIFTGLRYSIEKLDFELLHSLCNFASLNSYFSSNILKEFYQFIEDNLDTSNLSRVNYFKYINEIHLAKNILIDCPFNQSVMEITLKSNFMHNEIKKLSNTIKLINETLEDASPSTKSHILIRHNSPVEFTIVLSDSYSAMLLSFIALGIVFKHGTNFIEKIQKIIQNHQEIKSHKLEIKLKELELKEKETNCEKQTSSIICPNDFSYFSYILTNPKEIHKDLLRMRF